jgi:enamine deaminase RidA (YjgF/YER057c/UK114 family)
MSIQRHEIGARMSQAVVHNGTVYLAGQVAQNAQGASITEQTQDIVDTIDKLLAQCGSDKSKVLSATIWVNTMDDFAEMNVVWDAWVMAGQTPCRACVESARLAAPGFNVEIMVVAAV